MVDYVLVLSDSTNMNKSHQSINWATKESALCSLSCWSL